MLLVMLLCFFFFNPCSRVHWLLESKYIYSSTGHKYSFEVLPFFSAALYFNRSRFHRWIIYFLLHNIYLISHFDNWDFCSNVFRSAVLVKQPTVLMCSPPWKNIVRGFSLLPCSLSVCTKTLPKKLPSRIIVQLRRKGYYSAAGSSTCPWPAFETLSRSHTGTCFPQVVCL